MRGSQLNATAENEVIMSAQPSEEPAKLHQCWLVELPGDNEFLSSLQWYPHAPSRFFQQPTTELTACYAQPEITRRSRCRVMIQRSSARVILPKELKCSQQKTAWLRQVAVTTQRVGEPIEKMLLRMAFSFTSRTTAQNITRGLPAVNRRKQ